MLVRNMNNVIISSRLTTAMATDAAPFSPIPKVYGACPQMPVRAPTNGGLCFRTRVANDLRSSAPVSGDLLHLLLWHTLWIGGSVGETPGTKELF
jgi:hypothetical protein